MRIPAFVAWLFGVALLAALLALNDPLHLLGALAALRWWLVITILFHAVPLFFDSVAWRLLFLKRPPLHILFAVRWIAEGVNGLFPIPHLGELLRARHGQRLAGNVEGVATVVVDVTLGVVTQALFAVLGLALFSTMPSAEGPLRILLPATALIATGGIIFYFLQRAGLFALAGAIIHRWSATARRSFDLGSAQALDASVRDNYGRRRHLLWSALWRLGGWIAGAGEAWLVFYALGRPITFGEAIILESLSHAARTAAFFVPGGLGVQDGALMFLCAALGLGPESGLILALAKRCRELSLGLPALLTGYALEARHLTRGGAIAAKPAPSERSSA